MLDHSLSFVKRFCPITAFPVPCAKNRKPVRNPLQSIYVFPQPRFHSNGRHARPWGSREYYEKLPLPDIGLTKSLSAILFVILSVPFGKQQLRCFRVRYITAKPGPTPPSSHPTSSKAPTHSRIDETLLRRSLRLRRVHISSAFLS